MTLISLQAISKQYAGRGILHDLSWTIEDQARIGLVGPNGAGKSTILRIVAGAEEVDSGEMVRRRGLRLAFLPQHVPDDERTPLQIALSSRPDLHEAEEALVACTASLGDPEIYGNSLLLERALARQERFMARLEDLGGSGFAGEARAALLSLGLPENDLERPLTLLSGGQRKVALLSVCLARRPDLLLLDEPETHLDLPRREQLEEIIRQFSGAVVIVSHDRYLLDETATEIAELDDGRVRLWSGNYSTYAMERELALRRQEEVFASQQKEIERLEEAVRRFKLWASLVPNERHIKQARNKQRQIDQMEKVDRPVLERRKMALQLQSEVRGGQKIFELRALGMAFEGQPVLRGVNFTIRRGERVGVVAPNGAGKSVLGRILIGELPPTSGDLWTGPSVRTGYFAQGHETLDGDVSPLDLVRAARPLAENAAVSLLLRFLFRYAQVRQPVKTLSGGERTRLQLMLLMLGGANCLVLDEPTNHLDIDSAEVLEGALEEYDGTVVVISHDRYFLDRITDRILEIRGGQIMSHEGGYSDWSRRQHTA